MKKVLIKTIALVLSFSMLFSSGALISYAAVLSKPVKVSVSNKTDGIKIKWKKVKGAKGYRIYKKINKNGKWKKLKDVKSVTYLDKKVKNNNSYYYKIKAYKGKKKKYGKVSKTVTIPYISAPTEVKAVERYDQILVNYKKVVKAEKYRIYRKCGKNGKYKYVGVSDANFYFDNKTTMGETYYYKVRALKTKKGKIFKGPLSKQSNPVKCYHFSGECARSGHTLKGKQTVIKPTAVLKGYTETFCKCGLKTILTDFKEPLGYTKPDPNAFVYPEAVKRNKASIDYLNMLLKKDKSLLLQVRFGTEDEIRYLKAQTDKIVKGCKTDYQKAKAIYDWLLKNVEYEMYVSQYSVEVFMNKKAVCLGYANLMTDMLRLENIPAAFIEGFAGDTKNTLTEKKLEEIKYDDGHAWVRFYIDGQWLLADPTFKYFNPSETELDIPSVYYTISSDYVAPYYKNMNMDFVMYSVYIDGRYYAFDSGKQVDYGSSASHYTSGFYTEFTSISCDSEKNGEKIIFENPMNSDYHYRLGEMFHGVVFDRIYGFIGCFAYNGMQYRQTDYLHSGKKQLLNKTYSDVFKYSDYNGVLRTYFGIPALKKGEKIKLEPSLIKTGYYYYDNDYLNIISHKWQSSNTSVATVDQNGVVTAVGTGEVNITYSYIGEPKDRTYNSDIIQIYVSNDITPIDIKDLAPRSAILPQRTELYSMIPY